MIHFVNMLVTEGSRLQEFTRRFPQIWVMPLSLVVAHRRFGETNCLNLICDLFRDAVSSSDHIWNGKIKERLWKGTAVPYLETVSRHLPAVAEQNHKECQYIRSWDSNLKPELPEYKSGLVPLSRSAGGGRQISLPLRSNDAVYFTSQPLLTVPELS
jgi:hypothetical protein